MDDMSRAHWATHLSSNSIQNRMESMSVRRIESESLQLAICRKAQLLSAQRTRPNDPATPAVIKPHGPRRSFVHSLKKLGFPSLSTLCEVNLQYALDGDGISLRVNFVHCVQYRVRGDGFSLAAHKWRGPELRHMPPKCAKRRAVLEESKVFLEAKADGEVFWTLLAYTTFEVGALPLLRLRRPAAKE